MTRFGIAAVSAATVALLASLGGQAQAQTQVIQQVLDRVAVFNRSTALEMKFDASDERPPDFRNFDLVESAGLGSCQLNGSRGLYCLDGRDVRRWQDPADGGPGQVEFSCANSALQLDAKRGDPCSAIAVAQNGDVWISGRRGSAYQLIKLVRKDADGACSEGSTLSATNGVPARYCFRQYASGRPLLYKLVVVEGEEAERFDAGTGAPAGGVLGLDVRNAVTYFSTIPGATPVDLVAGKTAWGLGTKEALLDLALLQVANGDLTGDQTDNFLLAMSSTGRVLARQTDQFVTATTIEAFNVPAERTAPAPPPAQCDTSAQRYGIAASAKSGRVYVTDRNYCQVMALQPAGPPFMGLVNVPDASSNLGADLTLATAYANPDPEASVADSGTYPPDGATVAPGIVIDLTECVGSCTLIPGKMNGAAASLFAVELSSPESRMVLYQVRNIPDCRYVPDDLDCVGKGAVFTPPGKPAIAAEQYLDVAKLLPPDITSQFPATDTPPPGLPPLLISPQYRGQSITKNYRFGAIFAIPEPGVVFKNVFELEFDIEKLADSELGCVLGYGPQTPLDKLLSWDVATWVSERFVAPGGPYGLARQYASAPGTMASNKYRYVDTIINTGCRNPLKSKGTGFSMIAYDLEIAYNPSRIPGGDDQDDIFARLVAKLFQDLKLAQTELACPSGVDSAGSDPLSNSACSSLGSSLLNAEDKLTKCIAATRQPKTSAVDQNCQAFETQFSAYRSQLAAIGPATATRDPANRIGGLKARSETLWHVYVERFLPSVPRGGFTQLPTP